MIKGEINPRHLREFHLDMKRLKPKVLFKGEWLPFVQGVTREMRVYPPNFPGNTYTRTGNLARRWEYAVLNPLSAEVSNSATYAGYVHGEEQMVLHAGHGWKRLFDIGSEKIVDFIKKIERKVERIWTF